MKTFAQFFSQFAEWVDVANVVVEARDSWADLAKPTAPPQLFHKDIGIPKSLTQGPRPGMQLKYGSHAQRAAQDDKLLRLPNTVPPAYTVIEVEYANKNVTKWVIRIPAPPGEQRDVILVVQPDGFVRTVWTNDKDDKHSTLKKWLYTSPTQFKR